jgi:ADP-ribosylglycohydrolase
MRSAPVGFTGGDVFQLGVELAALTHGHPTGYLTAGVLASVIQGISQNLDVRTALRRARAQLIDHEHNGETLAAMDTALAMASLGAANSECVQELGLGWVAEEALAIALYCALTTRDVRTGLLLAVNHSGDSDSTGAIASNLLGSLYGVESLPTDLLDQLEGRELITQIASDFADTFVDDLSLPYQRYPAY